MKRIFTIPVLIIITLINIPILKSDILGKLYLNNCEIYILQEGDKYNKDACMLKLVEKTPNLTFEYDLKKQYFGCTMYAVKLFADFNDEKESKKIFLESRFGGDGWHTGPIIQIFLVSLNGIDKLGEQELYDLQYIKKNNQIIAIEGNVLFSTCLMCDDPAGSPSDNFFIPTKIFFNRKGLNIFPTISITQKDILKEQFEQRFNERINSTDIDEFEISKLKELRLKFFNFIK